MIFIEELDSLKSTCPSALPTRNGTTHAAFARP
jgi:hypothetical protein